MCRNDQPPQRHRSFSLVCDLQCRRSRRGARFKAARYANASSRKQILGLRPEHITETRGNGAGEPSRFTVSLDVVEPMGMETMVFFNVSGTEVCGRVEPTHAGSAGEKMTLQANMDHMHLIDADTGVVL